MTSDRTVAFNERFQLSYAVLWRQFNWISWIGPNFKNLVTVLTKTLSHTHHQFSLKEKRTNRCWLSCSLRSTGRRPSKHMHPELDSRSGTNVCPHFYIFSCGVCNRKDYRLSFFVSTNTNGNTGEKYCRRKGFNLFYEYSWEYLLICWRNSLIRWGQILDPIDS
jgi:hypothetical protein